MPCDRVFPPGKQINRGKNMSTKTHATKGNDDLREQAATMSEMAEALRKNCEQALRSGLKFQEEASHWWGSVFNPAACAQHWQDQLDSATRTANSLMPLAQKPISELIDLAENNNHIGAGLMRKAIEAAQAPAVAESQAKWTEFVTSSLAAARSNTEAMSHISSNAIDSWAGFLRKNCEAEARTSKSA
jgi:hypothetical protein